MWCAIRVTADGGETHWLGNSDHDGRRSFGCFDDAAVFWQVKHAEAAIDLFRRQASIGTCHLEIVEVGDMIVPTRR